MAEWICLKCNRVFRSGKAHPKCCGKVEEFDVLKHGRLLIGSSNSWISVNKAFKNNKRLEEISRDLYNQGVFGAATIFVVFVEELIKQLENYKEKYG